jgi:Phage ABA sandwich domain
MTDMATTTTQLTEELTKLEAGRALDALVHERVFGREVLWLGGRPVDAERARQAGLDRPPAAGIMRAPGEMSGRVSPHVPWYSTRIEDAFPLLDRFEQFAHVERTADRAPQRWVAMVRRGERLYVGGGETAALAICRAVLRAIGERDG